jgi:hypothetical protein
MGALRDKVVATTPEGKRIFGYNEKGVPVCYATKTAGRGRCMSVMTSPNGRCKKHGGHAPAGIAHWNAQHLRSADNLPKHLQGDMVRALSDPDQLNLNHEIAMTDTHIARIKEALDTGFDDAAWKRMKNLADKLEYSLENDPEQSEIIAKQLILAVKTGSGERTVWREYHTVEEARRKLVETASKRELQLKTLLKGDQIIALVTSMAATARDSISKHIVSLEKEYIFLDRQTKEPVDHIPGHFKSDFLGEMSIGLGNLIGQSRPNADIPAAINVNKAEKERRARAKTDIENDLEA